MISVLFPGQGSQSIGMGKQLFDNFDYLRPLYSQADEILNFKLTKLIFEGPEELLNQTEYTQPAIFLTSYAIFSVFKNETNFKLDEAKFFAGHSLGEYTALTCSDVISFEEALSLLKIRGKSMQEAVPKNQGGMVAILGAEIEIINKLLKDNIKNFECFLANDNSKGQSVISGFIGDINKLCELLTALKIKFVKLPVSAPFHCKLMRNATLIMEKEIKKIKFKKPKISIFSNVTAKPSTDETDLKKYLIKQIESPVRWREIVTNMIDEKVNTFVEIGPGKVLSGLVKRINRNVTLNQINNLEDINEFKK